jgi:release factor glutamine methyltransferase
VLVARVRLLEVIQRSTSFLQERGVESPRLQVEWILAHHLRVPRLQLYLQFERELDAAVLDAVREAVRRRGRREPLQHVLGSAPFCGLDFAVATDVLVPRPETELLAEYGWSWLQTKAAAGPATEPVAALDWGTGSGCLAVVLALRVPAARIVAVDISPAALERARSNARRHGVDARISWFESDGCRALDAAETFDLVVANPPYVMAAEIATLAPEVRDYDPRLALDGGPDGLDFYRRLAEELIPRLRPDGRAMLEFGDGQAPAVARFFADAGWIVDEVRRDYSGRDRFLVARRGPPPAAGPDAVAGTAGAVNEGWHRQPGPSAGEH